MRKYAIFSVLLWFLLSCGSALAKPSKAEQLLAAAEANAAEQHKIVLLDFGATWCSNCRLLDSYLAAPEIRPIVHKYFVTVDVNVLEEAGRHPERNTPGAEKLYTQMGANGDSGVPFMVFLEASGKKIVDSTSPKVGSIGYPVAPEEIDWFMAMVKKAVPSITDDEYATLEKTLKDRAAKMQ